MYYADYIRARNRAERDQAQMNDSQSPREAARIEVDVAADISDVFVFNRAERGQEPEVRINNLADDLYASSLIAPGTLSSATGHGFEKQETEPEPLPELIAERPGLHDAMLATVLSLDLI